LPGLADGPVFDVPVASSGDMNGESMPAAAPLPLPLSDGGAVMGRLLKAATTGDGSEVFPPPAPPGAAVESPAAAPAPAPKRIDPSTEPLRPGMTWEWRRPDPDAPALDPRTEKRIREIVREEFREREWRMAARFRSRHVLMIDE
jgi:hypothetical protein